MAEIGFNVGDRVDFLCGNGPREKSMAGTVQRWRTSSYLAGPRRFKKRPNEHGWYDIRADHDGIERSVRPSKIRGLING